MEAESIISVLSKNNIQKEEMLAIALSGGADSIFLTHFLIQRDYNLMGLHLNHNLRYSAFLDQNIVENFCKKYNVKYQIFHWDGKFKKNLEGEAREARYKLFIEYCRKNKIKYLLTAHHANDQIETFLMNLERGSGIDGLSGIAESKQINEICIVRPMLKIFKKECLDYLSSNKIQFAIDESNLDLKFKRNKIRNILENFSDKNLNQRLLLAINHIKEARKIENQYIEEVFRNVICIDCGVVKVDLALFDLHAEYVQISILSKAVMAMTGVGVKPRLGQMKMLRGEVIARHLKCTRIRNVHLAIMGDTLMLTIN